MLAKALTCAVVGLEGEIVEVEVDISLGLPAFTIVGLPDAAVQEAKERVRAAIRNSSCLFPTTRITVNLAPADLKKEGPAYDLPIALGILMASDQMKCTEAEGLFLGELSLDGSVRHTTGMLPMVCLARDRHIKMVYVPAEDAAEAALIEELDVIPVKNLAQLAKHLRGEERIEPFKNDGTLDAAEVVYPVDMAFHASAALRPSETRETVEMPTSTGPLRKMERIGRLEFSLGGERLALSAFAEPGSSTLFVPFRDGTSGTETYPGGRYLDLHPTQTGLYEVDFNRAYHPYCYFNTTWECPIPPPENRLSVAIRAGEKLSESKRAELNPAG